MLPTIEQDALTTSTLDFLPEFLLCLAIVVLLVLRLFKSFDRTHLGSIALGLTGLALAVSVAQWMGPSLGAFLGEHVSSDCATLSLKTPDPNDTLLLFGDRHGQRGLLIYDHLTVYLRCFLYAFAVLLIWLSMVTGIPDRDDSADFYCLLLGATVGMALMAMSCHLLMVFIAIEMASLPSYALAAFVKGKRQASEAALKYVVYGGGSAGIMLYGISLLAGRFGTGFLPELIPAMVQSIQPAGSEHLVFDPVLILGTLFVMIGIAFKLAVVPFHFWCPDVFEGASAEVAGFLSVASKGAALALLARFTLMFGGLDPLIGGDVNQITPWKDMIGFLIPSLAFLAALTATFGNLAAYMQTNLKRLLAYSTIAHAGYMLMGLCTLTRAGVEAVLFYMVAYLFMNLGAFAVVAFLRNETGSENLDDFRGLVRRSPVMVITLAFFLLSLLGLPPLVGFAAKFQIFAVLYTEGQNYYKTNPGLGATLLGLLIIGGLNTVLSAVYYLKVLKVMILDSRAEDLEGSAPTPLREPPLTIIFSGLMALVVLGLGILWAPLDQASARGAARFNKEPGKNLARRQRGGSQIAPGFAPKGGLPKGPGRPKGKNK